MQRVKTLFKYGLWVILFFIFSDIMINIGLNTVYKNIETKNNLPQVTIQQAKATHVDGKISGIINIKDNSQLLGKYLKVDLYSKRDVLLGTDYIKIENSNEEGNQNFNLNFKYNDVSKYDLTIIDEIQKNEEVNSKSKSLFEGFSLEEMTTGEKIWLAILGVMIFA